VTGTPVGVLLSLAGLLADGYKRPAILGVVTGVLAGVLFFLVAICS
jgi:hypothetical protein